MATMTGKTVLITGGTSGIGRETAIGLAKLDAHIIVTGRNQARGEAGVSDIRARSNNDKVDLLLGDFTKFDDIRALAKQVRETYRQLDVLVNNVGWLAQEKWTTVDGFESTFAVNHLAQLLITYELLPLLKDSAPSRIINVTGGQVGDGSIDFDDLQAEKGFISLNHYSHAKRVMMATSYELAQRLEGTGVTLNVVYPGAANTNMTQNVQPDMMPWFLRLIFPLFKLMMRNQKPENAAVSSILLASEARYEGQSGNYYDTKGKLAKFPPAMIDNDVTNRLYEMSMEMIGLSEPTPIHD
ncbi:MAG: SDR family NAD(P)-dependent oxidoreductase [Chloroflexota bacterium]